VLLLDSSGAVLFANEEAHGRLGLPAGGQAEGKPLRLLVGKDNPLVRMIEAAHMAGTEVRDVALELNDGAKPNRVLVSVFVLGRGPEPPGMLVVLRDLESVKELEDVMEYSGRLVRLGGLIAGVGHQIRSPLNAMNLQLELLGQDPEHGAPMAPRLEAVRHEIERLDRTVDALMRFMRPQELNLAPVLLRDLLREVADQTVRQGIRVEYRFDSNLGPLDVDRALLGEALRNVISNAVEATPDGGTITLSTRVCGDEFAEISVIDEGPGIPKENIPRIFNLYFTTKSNGTGLGLPLALRAIDLHHGTMDVQPAVGTGTTIRIRLPLSSVPRHMAGAQVSVHSSVLK
jgi:signal transduction histidine kinase